MHRHEPHRRELAPGRGTVVLAVQRRLALAIAVEALVGELGHEVEEAAQVPALVELVLNVGVANMNNRITEAFWADSEPEG